MTRVAAAALAAAIAAAPIYAEQDRASEERHGPAPDHVFKMVDGYFLGNLKERLDLTDEEFGRVVPHVQRLQTDRRELMRRRFRAMHALRKTLLSGNATEASVEELLREVKAVEAEESAALRRDREAIDGVLSPLQQAKFRLLEVEMERRVRNALSRSHGPSRSNRPPRGDERRPPPQD